MQLCVGLSRVVPSDGRRKVLAITSSNTKGASVTYAYDVQTRLCNGHGHRVAAQGGYSCDPVGGRPLDKSEGFSSNPLPHRCSIW